MYQAFVFNFKIEAQVSMTNNHMSALPLFQIMTDIKPTPLPIIIGIAGASASGKTSIANAIADSFGHAVEDIVQVIPLVWFHKSLPIAGDDVYGCGPNCFAPADPTRSREAGWEGYGPDSIDFDKVIDVFDALRRGEQMVWIPGVLSSVCTTPIIILDGLYSLYDQRLAALMNVKVFVECDGDTLLTRYIRHSIESISDDTIDAPKCHIGDILNRYESKIKPAADKWIMDQCAAADIIVPNRGDRPVKSLGAIAILHDYICSKLIHAVLASRLNDPQ
jgi:uridine kinase